MLVEALQSLQGWEVAAQLRRSLYLYPALNTVHIFALTLLVGTILPADLRLLGLFPHVPAPPFLRLMTGFSATGLALAILSGFLLFSVKPTEYAANAAFLAKLSLVAAGTLNALAIRFGAAWRRVLAGGPVGTGLRIGALLSLTIWIAALFAGRWIAFV